MPELIAQVDVVLGNLEDAIPADAKEAARAGFIAMAKGNDFGATVLNAERTALNDIAGIRLVTGVEQIIARREIALLRTDRQHAQRRRAQ